MSGVQIKSAAGRALEAKLQELLGERGSGKNAAVRLRDLEKLRDELNITARRIAELTPGRGGDGDGGTPGDGGAPADWETEVNELRDQVDAALQEVQIAVQDAANAYEAATAAGQYTDSEVQKARDDLEVDFQAAVDAAGQAGTARDQSLLAVEAAGGHASAASESARLAAAHEDEAGQSAAAANTDRLAAETARSQADTFRQDAVVAKEDAETARAGAQSLFEMSAQIASRGISVLSDSFLTDPAWKRVGSAGTLTKRANEKYPAGTTWDFDVAATQDTGLEADSTSEAFWPGQINAKGYVMEIEFSIVSGSVSGSGFEIIWYTSAGNYSAYARVSDTQAGESGVNRTARAVLKRPVGYSGEAVKTRALFHVNAVKGWLDPRAAKRMKVHRINVRVATDEEFGRGQVMAEVQSHLTQNYLTTADTNQAISSGIETYDASLGDLRTTVSQSSTAIANLQGGVAGLKWIAQAGDASAAGIEAVSIDKNGNKTRSALVLHGDNVIAPKTFSASRLIIHDPTNLVPDNQFQSAEEWGLPKGPYRTVGAGDRFNSIGSIYYDHSLATGSGWQGWVTSREFSAEANTDYHVDFRVVTYSGANCNFWYRFVFIDQNGDRITTTPIHAAAIINGHKKLSTVISTPGNCQRAQVEFNIDRDASTGDARIGDLVVSAKRDGAVLITPGGVTAPLITAETTKALNARFNDLRSANIKVGNAEIDTAHIRDLAVDRLKLADGAVTTEEYSYTSGGIRVEAGTNWSTIQTLRYTPGRTGPQTIELDVDWDDGGDFDLSIYRVQGGVWTEIYFREVPGPKLIAINPGIIIDKSNISGQVVYNFRARTYNQDRVFRRRFMRVLNAHK